jgi:hypothetical protein
MKPNKSIDKDERPDPKFSEFKRDEIMNTALDKTFGISVNLNLDQLAKLRQIFQYMKDDHRIPIMEKLDFIDLSLDIMDQVNQQIFLFDFTGSIEITAPERIKKIEAEIVRSQLELAIINKKMVKNPEDENQLNIYKKYLEKLKELHRRLVQEL